MSLPDSELDKFDNMYDLGVYLGYPSCCIDTFLGFVYSGKLKRNYKFTLKGTGFVPCETCASRPVDEMVALIDSTRKASVSFKLENKEVLEKLNV